MASQEQHTVDVAVIGAGCAGLYSAYRLLTGCDTSGTRNNFTVSIFETENRLGGRVHSVKLGSTSEVCELGAMRYLPIHTILNTLVERVFAEKYNVASTKFDCGDSRNHMYYVRSERFLRADIEENNGPAGTPFGFETNLKGKSLADIYFTLVSKVLQADGFCLNEILKNSHSGFKRWDHVRKVVRYRFAGPFENQLLYQMRFADVLRDQFGEDMFNFIRSVDGYDSTFNYSATDVVEMSIEDALHNCEYRTVKGGLDVICHCFAKEIEEAGGTIYFRNTLRAFSKLTNSPYRYELSIHNTAENRVWKVHANNIILCIPRRGLELLDQSSCLFKKDAEGRNFDKIMRSVLPVPATKVFLSFAKPWWKDCIGLRGKGTTDLPLRQSYFFGVPEGAAGNSVVLSSYADMEHAQFWRRLQPQYKSEIDQNEDIGHGSNLNTTTQCTHATASSSIVGKTMKYFTEMYGEIVEIPQPGISSAYMDWSKDPHGGAYHFWKPGARDWELAPLMRRPRGDERIFIAGEAYSTLQGWMEGAFCSAELVMRQNFSLLAPKWLDENTGGYDLGI